MIEKYQVKYPCEETDLVRITTLGTHSVIEYLLSLYSTEFGQNDISSCFLSAIAAGLPLSTLKTILSYCESKQVPLIQFRNAVKAGNLHLIPFLLDLLPQGDELKHQKGIMFDIFGCKEPNAIPALWNILLPYCVDEGLNLPALAKSLCKVKDLWQFDEEKGEGGRFAYSILKFLVEGVKKQYNKETAAKVLGKCLFKAAQKDAPWGVLRFLLEEGGAPINAIDSTGMTALHWVAAHGRAEAVVNYLLEAGADPSLRDESGTDAFTLVAQNQHNHLCDVLLPWVKKKKMQT